MDRPPPQPYWPAPPSRPAGWQSPGAIVGIVVAVVFAAVIIILFTSTVTFGGFPFPTFMFLPFCGIFAVIVVVIIFSITQGMNQPRIPPPPPIQQPMVPAGTQGSVPLNCPNCGAPPQNVDRFGVATCPYCSTRFLVR